MRHAPRILASIVLASTLAASACAQTTRPATRPAPATRSASPAEDVQALLAPRYTRIAAGFSFCPPVGGKMMQRLAVGVDEPFVTFHSEEDRWTLKILQMLRTEPTRLVTPRPDEPGAGVQRLNGDKPAPPKPGLLDELASQIERNNPGTQPLRKEVINLGRYDTGLMTSRYTLGVQTWLHQQAIIQAGPTHFYVIDFTSPSGWTARQGETEDTAESIAVALFDAMLRSVQIFDTEPVKRELDHRIYAGMALGVNLAKRAETSLIPEQYYRIVRRGKDIGWLSVIEKFDNYNGKHGLRVATATATKEAADGRVTRIDAELFSTVDRRQPDESWVSRTTVGGMDTFNEFGQSIKRNRPKVVQVRPNDPKEPVKIEAHTVEEQKLTVNQSSRGSAQTIERDLANPYCYLPQAWTLLLPRLLPIKERKQYAFASWVPSEREIIWRYLDTEGQRDIRFNGQNLRAWVVRDRISLEGDPTFHYFNADGVYIGSETPTSGVSLIPASPQALKELHPDDDFAPLPLLKALVPPPAAPGGRPSLMPGNPNGR